MVIVSDVQTYAGFPGCDNFVEFSNRGGRSHYHTFLEICISCSAERRQVSNYLTTQYSFTTIRFDYVVFPCWGVSRCSGLFDGETVESFVSDQERSSHQRDTGSAPMLWLQLDARSCMAVSIPKCRCTHMREDPRVHNSLWDTLDTTRITRFSSECSGEYLAYGVNSETDQVYLKDELMN